jgi:cell wall-associated NlpC family hydrolase
MIKNANSSFLLLIVLSFLLTSCDALKPISSDNGPTPLPTPTPSPDPLPESTTSELRQDIVLFAKKQLGSDYKYAGRTPKGFDCSGFTHYVMRKFEVDLTPVSRVQEGEGRTISVKDAQPGDLIFFRREKSGNVFHVALVVDHNRDGLFVIHSTSSRGVVIDNIYENSYWKSKHATARDVLKN